MTLADLGSDFATSPNADGDLDLDPNLRIVSGRRVLAEAIARRLETPRGQNLSDPDYGTDVRGHISSASSPLLIERQAENECLKDERVENAEITVTTDDTLESLTLDVVLTDSDGPFTFVLAVSGVTVELLTEGL